ncbi:MAG TPA: DegT/DnrJ/EryC1/StrS family aminotransferase [Candidatus Binataceae bacterium]|nr:DegT/DnrJ/EryC1/StrS family aminotransferase [Candidatus Binataceae bacterium]
MIKFVDLPSQNREIRERVERELGEIHRSAAYIGGPAVDALEQEFAAYLGVRQVVGVGSGTDALRLALMAAGVSPGDEVITSPMTFVATAEAICQSGALPVFVDVDRATANLDPEALRKYLAAGRWRSVNGPRAIVPVHLYGLPAPMDEVRKVAEEYNLVVIEDACQAHGARLRGAAGWAKAGSFGAAGCFSFYPGKNLGAWGEAGAVATNNESLAARIRTLRDHGRISHYAHQEYGYNARLDAVQAVVLRAKLARLEAWNARRRRVAELYRQLLAGCEVTLPTEPEGTQSSWHLFVIRHPRRDAIRRALLMSEIECAIHYPVPLHLQPACKALGYQPGDFPASESIADTVLSLPMHPHLSDDDVARVAEAVRRAIDSEKPVRRRTLAKHYHVSPPTW